MITVYLHANHESVFLDTAETLEQAVNGALQDWCETEKPQLFWFTDENDRTLATLFRGETPESAILTYANGTLERYHVVYNTTNDGRYKSTTITRHSDTLQDGWSKTFDIKGNEIIPADCY
jgi:hypothetical protein